MKLVHAILFAGLVAAALAPAAAAEQGEGFGVTPVRLSFTDPPLVRDGSSEGSLRVQNWFREETEVTITPEGSFASWLTIEPASPFRVAAGSSQPILVKVNVPKDAANGDYSGLLRIRAAGTGEPSGSGASINVEVLPRIDIRVGGEQVLRFAAENPSFEERSGAPAFNVDVLNRGNVRAAPVFELTAYDEAGEEVLRERLVGSAIDPGKRVSQRFEATTRLPAGEYVASLRLENALGSGVHEDLLFRILPEGMGAGNPLSNAKGRLAVLEAESDAEPGGVIAIMGRFHNTGSVEVPDARLTVEVFRDNRRIDVVHSDTLRVPAGGVVDLEAFHEARSPGDYVLRGYVTYAGFRTPTEESSFTVRGEDGTRADASPKGGDGKETPGVGAILGVLALAGAALARRRAP